MSEWTDGRDQRDMNADEMRAMVASLRDRLRPGTATPAFIALIDEVLVDFDAGLFGTAMRLIAKGAHEVCGDLHDCAEHAESWPHDHPYQADEDSTGAYEVLDFLRAHGVRYMALSDGTIHAVD